MTRSAYVGGLFILVSALSQTPIRAGSISDIEWLAGCWARRGGQAGDGGDRGGRARGGGVGGGRGGWAAARAGAEAGSEDHWLAPAGGSLLGVGRTVVGGKTVAYEFMQI